MEGTSLEMVTATNDNKPCQDLKIVDLNKYNIYPSYRVGQKEAIESILENYEKIRTGEMNTKITELSSPTGSGKCLGKNTRIIMYDGTIKKVQDVKIGDLLLGPDSRPRRVLNLSHGIDMLYKITPIRGGESFICTGNHVLNLTKTNGGTRNKLNINITVDEYLSSHKTFKHIYKLWHPGVISFECNDKSVPIPPYLLGIWLGDGHNGSPAITNPDHEIEKYLYEYAEKNNLHIRISHQTENKTQCPTFHIVNKKNKGRGSDFGHFVKNIKNKCGVKRIPFNYLTNTVRNRRELLAGILDADGYYSRAVYELIVKNDDLASDIAFLARSLGISVSMSKKIGTIKSTGFSGIYNRLSMSGNELASIPCKIHRKKFGGRNQKKRSNVTGFSIEPIGHDEFFGFEVSDDHLFMLGDFTVTHNSLMLAVTARALLELYPDEIKKVVYTTPLKALVYQIEEDEQLGIPVVLGKSNYDCLLLEGLDASDCPFRSASLAKQKPKICNKCPYILAKNQFRYSNLAACTLDFFIYNRASADILIIDESASLEDKLLNHFGIALPEKIDLKNLTDSIHQWMISLEEESENYTEMLESMNLSATNNTRLLNDIRYVTTKLTKIERQVAKCGRILQVISSNEKAYFIDKDRNLKLIRGEYPFNSMASRVKMVIMSSGTPTTSLICRNYSRVEAVHPIPKRNRLIYYEPVGKMSRANLDNTVPGMAKRILEIHKEYPRQTIVHCHSYGIAQKLKDHMRHPKVLQQTPGHREDALRQFMRSKECIFLSVNYAEGINLKGENFQRNIIAKVPYPSLGDEWVIKRNETDKAELNIDKWYRLTTAVAIQQAAGRTTRDPDDFSKTYILDSNFGFFYSQNKNLLEPWFRDAIVWRK